ncbi:MAG: competence/damage-inducible protein A [Lachnospiraceae bacterium]|nr:competence/damage-inducible protein A [Lachnospiraceae bacterium]
MIVETICVGTELLLGNTVNTNAAYLAGQYAALGMNSYYQTVVGDNAERIVECVKLALSRSDMVVMCGGLGPTPDDITRETVAELLGRKLYEDETTLERIRDWFGSRGLHMSENNRRQAMVPEDAVILDNDNGMAPGILIRLRPEERARLGRAGAEDQTILLLPGPPEELSVIWENRVKPILQKEAGEVICSSMVKVCGRSESEVAELLDDLINSRGDVTVAPYAKTGEVHMRLTARAADEKTAKKLIKPVIKDIKGRLGDSVYTTQEDVTLEKALVELLLANHLTVTTAESCTGGLIAARLVNVPGVSEIFKCGFVTYSNKAKRKLIGVKRKTLDKFGAVSAEVVREMAEGAAFYSKSDVSVAVSGIAGPDGGTEEKPVGLVYIGVNVCGNIRVKEFRFSGNREKVRNQTVASAMILLRECILGYYSRLTFGEKENG